MNGDWFQSLFLWNSLNGLVAELVAVTVYEVSILVFVEFAQRPIAAATTGVLTSEVSILVFVEFAQRRPGAIKLVRSVTVSILVFVEFAQRRPRRRSGRVVADGFQSLFLWNSLNGQCVEGSGRPASGFNPCFCGIRSSAWHESVMPRGRDWSFNPCFCGIRSTAVARTRHVARPRRVSILVFVEFAQRPARSSGSLDERQRRFQSLFLWISLNGSTTRIAACSVSRFQSLFLWNSLIGAAQHGPTPLRTDDVSILVFVDSLHGAGSIRTSRGQTPDIGFNPCFCGIRSSAGRPADDHQDRVGFQSLFLWNSLNGIGVHGLAVRLTCFNPCFCGIRSTAFWSMLRMLDASECFNPCFCGIRSTA